MTVQPSAPATPSTPPPAPTGATVTQIQAPTPYPIFEGRTVSGVTIQISGVGKADLDGVVLSTDDIVRIAGEFRCVSVQHKVDPKTGELMRVQTLTPKTIDVIPFDPADPNDDGVVRARDIPGWTP